MDIHSIKINRQEIQTELDRVKSPAAPAGVVDDACAVYRQARPALEVAMVILGGLYPPAAAAVAAAKVILDKVCEVS
jgi:hypothetical protein